MADQSDDRHHGQCVVMRLHVVVGRLRPGGTEEPTFDAFVKFLCSSYVISCSLYLIQCRCIATIGGSPLFC
jgi:hypothetical protein